MEFEAKDILELMRSVPALQAGVLEIKSSLAGFQREIDSVLKSVSAAESAVERVDVKCCDVASLKHTITSVQESIQTISDKLNDLLDKYRDILNAIKSHDRNIEEGNFQLMRTVHGIENATKEALVRHDAEEASLHAISKDLNELSKQGVAMVKTVTNVSDNGETMLERIVKAAPNFIAILTFLGYVIYNLIEHKLMGKM